MASSIDGSDVAERNFIHSGNDVAEHQQSGPPRLFHDSKFCSRCLELHIPDLYPWVITALKDKDWNKDGQQRLHAIVQRVVFDVDLPLSTSCLSCELIHDELYDDYSISLPISGPIVSTYYGHSASRRVRLVEDPAYQWTSYPFEPLKEIRMIKHADGEVVVKINIDDCPHNRLIRDPGMEGQLDIARGLFPTTGHFVHPGKTRIEFREQREARGQRRNSSYHSIDFGHLRHLLSFCRLKHETCKPIWKEELQSMKLIDVDNRTLVTYPTSSRPEYAALSYVWGGAEAPKIQAGNIPDEVLPTIEDAIKATKAFYLQYLWVDAICIDQDDLVAKMQQIGIMNHIYSGASVTFIAADGESAYSGLPRMPGWHSTSRPRRIDYFDKQYHHTGRDFGNHEVRAARSSLIEWELSDVLSISTWAKRGWTLQEALFSRRCFIFTADQVYHHCNELVCCETSDVYSESTKHYHPDRDGPGRFHGVPKDDFAGLHNPFLRDPHILDRFNRHAALAYVISQYSSRYFTVEEDTIYALIGVLNEFQATVFPAGFHLGLPLADFRYSLGWESSVEDSASQGRKSQFPSWSWIGWRLWGDFRFEIEPSLSNQPRLSIWRFSGQQILKTVPSVVKSECSIEAFVEELNQHFGPIAQQMPVNLEPVQHEHRLLVQGILIRLRFLDLHEEDSNGACRVESPLGTPLFATQQMTMNMLASDCSNAQSQFPDGTEKLLLLSTSRLGTGTGPFRPEDEDGLGLHLLFLKWDNQVAQRLGRIDVRLRRAEMDRLYECNPTLEEFYLA